MNTAMKDALVAANCTSSLIPHEGVVCPYCGKPALMVGGDRIYPHRKDLYSRKFWRCEPCDAYVGCHPINLKAGQDGTRPLGRLADKELRVAKSRAHRVFDPLWEEGHFPTRKEAYIWLAGKLAIRPKYCHIGHFSLERCVEVHKICTPALKALRGAPLHNGGDHADLPA